MQHDPLKRTQNVTRVGMLFLFLLSGTVKSASLAGSDEAYFGAVINASVVKSGLPFEPPRLRDISPQEFSRFASAGWPVIVTDVSRDWPMRGWTCDSIGKKFAGRKMRREYAADTKADPEENDQLLSETAKWANELIPSGSKSDAAPKYAPYYWDVKDADARGEADLLREISAITKVPYFMSRHNAHEMKTSPEFWFSAPGAGAKVHMDSHCQATMSVQLSGTKRWRLGPIPEAVAARTRAGDRYPGFVDGSMYDPSFLRKELRTESPWTPVFEFTLREGEGVFFPPGFLHETTNVGDTCAASVTYQFDHPIAARYFKQFMPRVHRTADMQECWGTVADLATAGHTKHTLMALRRAFSTDRAAANAVVQNISRDLAATLDADADGVISTEELKRALGSNALAQLYGPMRPTADDVISFHDHNVDGRLDTRAEFARNVALWVTDVATLDLLPRLRPQAEEPDDAEDGDEGDDGNEEEGEDGHDSEHENENENEGEDEEERKEGSEEDEDEETNSNNKMEL